MSIIELKIFYNNLKESTDKLNNETNNKVIDLTLQVINNKLNGFKSCDYNSSILHHLYEMDEEFPEYLLNHNMEYLSLLINGRTLSHIIDLDNNYSIIYDIVDDKYIITRNSKIDSNNISDEESSDDSEEFSDEFSDELDDSKESEEEFDNICWVDPAFNETEFKNWLDNENQNVELDIDYNDSNISNQKDWNDMWNNQYSNSSEKSERKYETEVDNERPAEKSDLLTALSCNKNENNIAQFNPEVDDLTGSESLIDKIKERKLKWKQIEDEIKSTNSLLSDSIEEIKLDNIISNKISLTDFKEKVKQKAKNKILETKN